MKKTPSKISKPQSLRVLMVEDSENDALLIIRELKKGGYDPVYERVETATAMKKALKEKQWDIILCDYTLPKFSVAKAIALLKETNIDIPFILVTGSVGEEVAVECMRLGAHDYIMKNNLSRLCPAIARELEEAEVRNKQRQAEEALRFQSEIITNMSEGVNLIRASDKKIIYTNPRFDSLFGYEQGELIGKSVAILNEDTSEKTPQEIADSIEKAVIEKGEVISEILNRRKDGSSFWCLAHVSAYQHPEYGHVYISVHSDITEHRRAESEKEAALKALRSERVMLARTEGIAHVGSWEWNIATDTVTWSDELFRIFQRDPREGAPSFAKHPAFYHPDDMARLQQAVEAAAADGTPYELELRAIRKDGETRLCVARGIAEMVPGGRPVRLFGSLQDITERKQAESQREATLEALRQSEEKYRNILENIEDGYYEVDLAGNFIFSNASMCRILGYPQEEMLGMNNRQFTDKEHAKKLFKTFNEVYRTGQPAKEFDWQVIRKDGDKRYIEVSVSLQKNSSGKPIGFQGVARDITERKRAEQALLYERNFAEGIIETAQTIVLVLDTQGRIVRFNPYMEEISGYALTEMQGKDWFTSFLPQRDRERIRRLFRNAIGNIQTHGNISPIITKDGREREIDWYDKTFKDVQGNVVGLLAIGQDITEQKKAEEVLRESENKYKSLVSNVPDIIFTIDLEGNITFASQRIKEILGYESAETINMNILNFIPEEDRQSAMESLQKGMKGEKITHFQTQIIAKSGEKLFFECSFSRVYKDGAVVGALGTAVDITDRKRAESQREVALEALRVSEEKYRLITENTADLITVTDMNLRFTYISPSIMRTHGFTVEEAMNLTLDQFLTPGSLQILLTIFEEEMKLEAAGTADPGRIHILEVEEYKKDGSIIWLECGISAQRDKENKLIGILTVSRDITERKRAEQALQVSEAQYRLLADNIKDQVWLMDMNLKPTYISPSVEKSRGYTFEEIAQLPLDKQLTATSLQLAMEFFSIEMPKALADPTYYLTRLLELEFYCKDGSTLWLENTFTLIRDENGKPLSFLGAGRDISKRKQAEQALQESEKYFKEITENSSDIIVITDKNGDIKYCSRSTERFIGYKPEELIGRSVISLIHPDDVKRAVDDFGKAILLKDSAIPNAFRIVHKDGSERYFGGLGKNLLDNQAVAGFIMNIRDITERKQAEEESKQSFERMRKALGATVQAICLTVEMKDPYTSGHQQRVADLARSMATEMGLSADRRDFIRTASAIHDIGKIAIPTEILSKPTKLTDLEFNLIKTHAQSGYDILKDIEFPWPVADVVLQHHERLNGSGYPQGLKGNDIFLEARILAVADVVEAMASHRPYRPALGIDLALEEISGNKGILYDADAVDACLKLFREKGYTLVLKKS